MNFKRSTTSMALVLIVLSLVSMTSIQQDAFAQTQGMTITATADKGSDIITVTGKTVSSLTDVTFTVTSPSGNNVVDVAQVTPDGNGDFGTEFKISSFWKEDGFYTITAKQSIQQNSLYSLKVFVEITNGMTERTSSTESNLVSDSFVAIQPTVTKDAGLEIYADAVVGSTTIEITGWTDRVSQDVTLTVTSPNGNKVSVGQVSPMLDGEFTSVITTGGPLWIQDGFYTVTAQQFNDPKYIASTEVDIKDGVVVPEFGTIAAMILAVAIISIIAISAKSRLSIMPRY
jgi:predicted secreted protein with PEFG-CTERM motif